MSILNQVDADHSLVAKGALNYVVVGGGPTGVETAGAIAEILHDVIDDRYAALTDRAPRSTWSTVALRCSQLARTRRTPT